MSDADVSPEPGTSRQPALRVAFVLEQHVGHRTYATNLRRQASAFRVDASWIDVLYEARGRVPRFVPDGLAATWAARREVRNGLRRVERDVTVFNTQVPAALGGRAARRRPYVVITDVTPVQYDGMAEGYGHAADGGGLVAGLKHRLNRTVFQDAATCVAWSTWAAESIVSDYGVPGERVEVIAPGVDVQAWAEGPRASESGRFRVLFVGGEFERKGGHDLLAVLDQLPDHAELVVVTKSDVAQSERVRVVSDLGPNDPRLIALYQQSDVFALPSRAETFGIAAVEASAAGLPIVASSVGGLPDIVADGETGLLVPAGNRQELAAALRALHDDPTRRTALGAAARQRARAQFDAATNTGRLLAVAAAAAGREITDARE